jgi:hypothetical protein
MTPDELLKQAILNDQFPEPAEADRLFVPQGEDALRLNRNIALSAWMTRTAGRDINSGSIAWQADKDALAQGYFQMKDARNVSDEQLHTLVKSHIQIADEAADIAARTALSGIALPEAMAELEAKRGPSQLRGVFSRYTKDLAKRHTALAVKLAPYRGVINETAAKLKPAMESAIPSTEAFQSVAERLLAVPDEMRPLVISAIGETGGKDAKERAGYLSKLAGAFGRMSETVGAAAGTTGAGISETLSQLANAPAEIASLLSGGVSLQSEAAAQKERSKETEARMAKAQQMRNLTQQVRTVADSMVSPIKGDGWWSQLGIDVARMVPQSAATIINPALGFGANLAYFRDTIAAQAKMENPALTYEQADAIGIASAPLNAAVETVTALIPFGKVKLPFVQRWLQSTTTSIAGAARNLAIRASAGTAGEIGEEYAQSFIPLQMEGLVTALEQDMPGVDWEKRMPKFSEIASQTWGPALVYSLVGGGAASIRDINRGRELAMDVDAMVATGIAPDVAEGIAKKAEAGDWSGADAGFQANFESDKKATTEEKAGALARFMEKQREAQKLLNRDAAEAENIGVAVIRDESGWKVRMSDGTTVPAESQEVATQMQRDFLMASSEYEAETTIAAVDELLRLKPDQRVEITAEVPTVGENGLVFVHPTTGQKREIKDTASIQNLRDEQMALANKEGEADVVQTILGENHFEFGRAVSTVFMRSLNKDGTANIPRIITALHEHVEASWRKGVALGKFTEQESRNAVATLISQLDPKRLGKRATQEELNWFDRASRVAKGEGDENLLREVISELAVRTWIGRDKTGERTGMTPGTILRALDSAVLTARKPAEMTLLRRLRAWVKAVGAYLRGVIATAKIISQAEQNGTVGDFTEFMDKLLGLTEQTREDATQADQIRQQMESDGMAFSIPGARAKPITAAPVVQMPDGAQLIGPSTFSITAYHGTPHKVDKFTTSKIGTGEGAQAYGWGLYFAEARKVAEEYSNMRATPSMVMRADGKPLKGLEKSLAETFFSEGRTAAEIAARENGAEWRAAWNRIKDRNLTRGNLYTVELLPDEADFLDWDKPLSEQSERVKNILDKAGIAKMLEGRKSEDFPDVPLNIYVELAWDMGEQKASEYLASLGIPGIKYLDAGSRGSGDGTRNYVIFDEKLVKILEENGQPVGSTFSLSPTSSAEQLANIIESIMQARPELAFKIRQRSLSDINRLVQNWSAERVTWKGDKIRPVVEKRTKASLDKEQAMRQATREAELVDAGMATLTPETLMAWSEGVAAMNDHPLIKQMLGAHGRLMSKTTAANLGKLKTDGKGKAGDYDEAGWIPPSWYAGAGSGIMPDVMAANLYDDGILNEPTPDALWKALDSVVTSQRAARAEYAKAESAVKDVEKKAREQAKAEAQQWRDETEDMVQDDWSPRESLQRDARLFNTAMAAFPAEIRGKIVPGGMVKLTGQATERARYKTIEKAMQKAVVELEKFMRKEITAEVDSLLDRYASQKGASGRMEGKLLSNYTELVDYASFIRNADVETVANEEKALDAAIADSQDADETASLMSKIGVLRQFELWSDKDSVSMADAMKWLQDIVATGKLGKKILDEERKATLDELRGDAIKGALPDREVSQAEADNETTAIQSSNYRKAAQALRGMMGSILWTTAQRLELLFGEDSKVTRFFADRLVSAANQETDILRNIDAQRREALSVILDTESTIAQARAIGKMQAVKKSGVAITEGRKTETVKLDIETLTKLSDGTMTAEAAGLRQDQVETALEEWAASDRKRTVTVEKVLDAGDLKPLDMSEMQGIQYLLWSRQDASRKQMERDGWTEDSFRQLDEFLSPQAVALANWMASSYDAAAKMIDPVYRRLFNAPLPRIKNYAPIYRHRSGDASVMELDGSDISSGMTAGFTKSRVNTTSPLMRMDAMAVFLGHWQNVAHWVSHAEIMRDTKAVMLDKNVQTAIRQKSGDASLTNLKTNIANIEAAGTRAVKDIVFLSRFWQNLMQYRAFKALAFRISPVAKQSSAALNPLLADVPAHAYSVGLVRALTSPVEFASDVSAMWKSDIIQRRIQGGFSAEARVAMQNAGVNGSMLISLMQKGMLPMAWTDAGWTAIGSAIAFDYYRRSYFAENSSATAEQADAYAAQRLERMIATSAQPSDLVNRSIAEQSTNIFAKAMWMFLSDQRKAAAIELMAIKRLASGKSKNKAMDIQRVLVAHVAQAAVTQLSVAVLASVLGKPEDEEREWSREQWAATLALGPVGGIFVLGRGIEYGVKYLLGLRVFGETTLTEKVASDVYRAGRDINDLFSDDPEDVVSELDKLSSATGSVLAPIFGPQAGAVDVMGNVLREARKIGEAVSRDE